jgi:drug/metabolite transporter (DMT)-like permease
LGADLVASFFGFVMEIGESKLNHGLAPHIALLLVQMMFGSLPVIGKMVLKVIPAFGLVGFRVGITAVCLVIFQRFRGNLRLADSKDYWRLFVLSVFGVSLNQVLFISGLSLTKASNSSLLAVTIPIFALTVGAVLGVEKLRFLKIVGILLAAVGVILLLDPRRASFSSETTLGDILIICNSFSYGIYVAASKETISRNGAIKSMTWLFIFAAMICIPLGAFSMRSVDFATVTPTIWLLIFYCAIISTALPYILNAWALARVNPSTVAVYVYLQPIFGFIMAVVFLNEEISILTVLAACLIFAGVFLVTKKINRRDSETQSFS